VVLALLGDVVALASIKDDGPNNEQQREATHDDRANGEALP
jgi:hypothetical protein